MHNILVVDDDPNIALLVHMTLAKKPDYKVTIANSGQDALDIIAQNVPDLVLLDIMMPDMDGFEVCRKIKQGEKTKFLPVIMVSAKSELRDKLHGMDIGANDYITKPFNPEELLARVSAHLRIKSLEDQLASQKELEAALKMSVTLQHEINNPLTGVIGNLELMKDWRDSKPEEVDEAVNDALALSLRIKLIVQQLSRLTRVIPATYIKGSEMINIGESTRDQNDK
ncbi:MAG: response regulator [Nitrospinae bacterium]|nr:response regulator [Nitrospinota bacterium]